MLAEWSAECSADDSVLVVPWRNPHTNSGFVDLRSRPYDFDHIPETTQYPPLMQALRVLNGPRSPVFTAKCDAWSTDPDELTTLRANLDEELIANAGVASYIDILWRDRAVFSSFPRQQQLLTHLVRLALPLQFPSSTLEYVLRPAVVDFDTPQEGYSVSMYVKSIGADDQSALEEWGKSLAAAAKLLRACRL
jgi:hypothetical protein